MIAFSGPQLPNFGWPLEEPLSHDQTFMFVSNDPQNSHPPFTHHLTPLFHQNLDLIEHYSESPVCNLTDPGMVKKLHHNAIERDRRKKLNYLYLSLRSLLPADDQTKKLSIPATVSRVVKYIPELQQLVKRLGRKKEDLLNKSKQDDLIYQENQSKSPLHEAPVVVSINRLSDTEVVVQISHYKTHNTQLSTILLYLENEGFVLLNSSSFETSGGRIFHTLHFQVQAGFSKLEYEDLSRKIGSLYDLKEMFHFDNDPFCIS